jgi:MraZ protein
LYNSGDKWEKVENKLIGNYQNKIDEKGRMTIPTKFRADLTESVVISYGFDKTLEVRGTDAFET